MIGVVTDSTADLPAERAQRLGIEIVPLVVEIDGVAYDDGSELPAEAFYEKLRQARGIPSTSQPAIGRFKEAYERIDENPFRPVSVAPLSTFSVDVDRASYTNVRRFLTRGSLPPRDAVRIEELVN